jgi:hypothetical protein
LGYENTEAFVPNFDNRGKKVINLCRCFAVYLNFFQFAEASRDNRLKLALAGVVEENDRNDGFCLAILLKLGRL